MTFLSRISLIAIILSTAGCSWWGSGTPYDDNDSSVENLKTINQKNVAQLNNVDGSGTIRNVALYEMALSYGMRSGLYSRANEINAQLIGHNELLEELFDFRELILPDRIMPPVLIEAQKTMDAKSQAPLPNMDDTFLLNDNPVGKSLAEAKIKVERAQNNFTSLRITDRVYKIIRQARFAVTTPSWRDYLQMSFVKPMRPETPILPKNAEEQTHWARGIDEGWKLGLAQADQIFMQNLMLLRRDYLGMLRYRKLLAMNMVSAPYVAKRNYGVTGDGDEIKINDRVLTIAALPSLKVDSKTWQPHLLQNHEQELDNKLAQLDLQKMLKYIPKESQNGRKGADQIDSKDLGAKGFVDQNTILKK